MAENDPKRTKMTDAVLSEKCINTIRILVRAASSQSASSMLSPTRPRCMVA